ncbi:MAG: hypothetical protein JXR76_09835 [Deltaproteobacteria bacterium]|nr:hypothetical protein [Deltaproteobacteria bacterium]
MDDKKSTVKNEAMNTEPAGNPAMQRELQYNADREHQSADRIEKENRKWIAVKVKQMKQIRSAK